VELLGPIFEREWSRWSNCVSVTNFVAIDSTVAEIWKYFWIFQDGGRRHLAFLKFEIFNGRTAQDG